MTGYGKRQHALAIGLASLAGYVDAIGFLKLDGLFVSFMSGNSTRMSVGVAAGAHSSVIAFVLIAAFVFGVVIGALLGACSGRWRKQAVLALVTLLLGVAASAAHGGRAATPVLLMAAAMGAANNVFQRDGAVSVGVTYMTGTLVKFGQKLAATISGGAPLAWLPYLLLWLGLVAGAVSGAAAFPRWGLEALWIAAAVSAMLLGWAFSFGPLPIGKR